MKKITKLVLSAGLLIAGIGGNASAATVDVYITGSNTYRASVTNAIGHLLSSPQAAFVGTTGTGALAKASQQFITGISSSAGVTRGLTANTTYNFHTSYSGGLSGIAVLVYNTNTILPFIGSSPAPVTAAMTVGTGANSNSGADGGVGGATATFAGKADGAFSDVFQGSTPFKSTTLVGANPGGYGDGVLGVAPFVLVGNPDFANFVGASGNPITNFGATELKSLFEITLNLAQITGNDTDQGQVLPVGRNFDAATRFVTFAESGFNPVGDAPLLPTQYQVVKSGTAIDVSLYPPETLFSGTPAVQSFTSGQSGYSSGPSQATALSISGTSGSNSDNPSYLVGYLSEADASTVVKAGGSYLSYNGVPYGSFTTVTSGTTVTRTTSYNRTSIDEGLYTLWSYDHLYYRTGNGNAGVLDALAAQITAVDAGVSGELISNMAVQRGFEGAPISYVGVGGTSGL